MYSQFKSVFAPHSEHTFPQLPGTQCPKIKPLHISENCDFMLLDRIDVSKSFGPDKLPGRLLQCLAKEITPIVHYIFTQSLCTGQLPTEWTQANVAPILKKGSKLQPVNYRPVSLTCKLFEYIMFNLAQMHNKKGSQIDIAVLDFSKTFDTVPHDGLLSRLKHYGIDDKICLWNLNFLKKTGNKV